MNSKPKSNIHKRQSNKPREQNRRRFPNRWLQYVPVGRDIPGLRIMAFKTPLHSQYFTGMAKNDETRFEVNTIISFVAQAGKTLGLVVDLTNTDKYYDAQDWLDNSVEYYKLRCRGHEVNQQEEIVQNFISTVLQFFDRNVGNEKVIGVHCTHGLNRTGYLICRYMIDYLGVGAAEAIQTKNNNSDGHIEMIAFEMNRGHSIERHHYITSLYESEAKAKAIGIPLTEALADEGTQVNPANVTLPENLTQEKQFTDDIVVNNF